MDLTNLKKDYPLLEGQVEQLLADAQRFNAQEGARRLGLVGTHYKRLSIDQAYHLIDPEAFQQEIEIARARKLKLGILRWLRNSAALFPLIMTWFALYQASNDYQIDLNDPRYKEKDQYISFLSLWQSGFHDATWLTFSTVALIDVSLLLFYLFLVTVVAICESNVQGLTHKFTKDLQAVVDGLSDAIATNTSALISDTAIDRIVNTIKTASSDGVAEIVTTIQKVASDGVTEIVDAFKPISDADVQRIVDAIKVVVADSLLVSKQVAQQAKQSMEDLFNYQIEPMVDHFNKDLGTLNIELTKLTTELKDYTEQLDALTNASTKIADNTNKLNSSAADYVDVSKNMRDQIILLNGTQQQVVSQIQSVASNMDGAAKAAGQVADRTNDVADKLITATQQDIATMAGRVMDSAQELARVAGIMAQINAQLQATNSQLQGTPGQVNQHMQNSLQQVDTNLQGSANQFSLKLGATADQLQAAAADLGKQIVHVQQLMAVIPPSGNSPTRRGRKQQAQVQALSNMAAINSPPLKPLPQPRIPWLPWNWFRKAQPRSNKYVNTKPNSRP